MANANFFDCYSVSAFEPSMAVLGIELDGSSTLFNPCLLSELTTAPTDEQIALIRTTFEALDKDIRDVSQDAEPQVIVFENTDD